jgi:hypothetical protein
MALSDYQYTLSLRWWLKRGAAGKGEAKRTFNICFAHTSKIPNIGIAHQYVLGAGQHYIVVAKDVSLIKI